MNQPCLLLAAMYTVQCFWNFRLIGTCVEVGVAINHKHVEYVNSVLSRSPQVCGFEMNSLRQCQWVPAVGLEIHAQISARTKIFSHGRTTHPTEGLPPNSTVALFDIALPGSMPVSVGVCVQGMLRDSVLSGTQ